MRSKRHGGVRGAVGILARDRRLVLDSSATAITVFYYLESQESCLDSLRLEA